MLLLVAVVHSFLLLNGAPFYGCTTVYSPVDGHLDCIQFLCGHNLSFLLGINKYLGANRMAGSYGKCIFVGAFFLVF